MIQEIERVKKVKSNSGQVEAPGLLQKFCGCYAPYHIRDDSPMQGVRVECE